MHVPPSANTNVSTRYLVSYASKTTYLHAFLGRVFLAIWNIVLGDVMEHVCDSAAGSNRVDCNLSGTAVLGEYSNKRVNGTFGTRVQGVIRDTKVFGCIGRHEDDTTSVIQVTVCLASHEELTSGVKADNAIKLLLIMQSVLVSLYGNVKDAGFELTSVTSPICPKLTTPELLHTMSRPPK